MNPLDTLLQEFDEKFPSTEHRESMHDFITKAYNLGIVTGAERMADGIRRLNETDLYVDEKEPWLINNKFYDDQRYKAIQVLHTIKKEVATKESNT